MDWDLITHDEDIYSDQDDILLPVPAANSSTTIQDTTSSPLHPCPESLEVIFDDYDSMTETDDESFHSTILPFDAYDDSTNFQPDCREGMLKRLENIALDFMEQLDGDSSVLTIGKYSTLENNGLYVPNTPPLLQWPKKIKRGSFKSFARLFRVIDIVHEALSTDMSITKRDIYYQDVALFKTQSAVDEVVEFLTCILEVPRGKLNVRASPKGLFCGSGLKLHLHQGGIVQGNDSGGTLIPSIDDISSIDISTEVKWVLIIEKEAVFQTLCRAGFTVNPLCPGRGLLITGKGYPDFATRELTNHLSTHLPTSVPLFALVDADAYGLDILSVFKHGSKTSRNPNNVCTAPRIQWIGLWGSEMTSLGINPDQLLPLSKHDHKKALKMLKRQEAVMPKQFRRELSYMLHTRKKAELEILTSITPTLVPLPCSQLCTTSIPEDPFKPIAIEPAIVQYLIAKFKLFSG